MSPVQGVVSREPGQSFHQNAIMATAGSANVEIGPRISSDVGVLPVPRARAKNTAAPSSSPPSPSQGWAASRCSVGNAGSVPGQQRRVARSSGHDGIRLAAARGDAAGASPRRCASRCSMAMGSSRTR